MEQVKFNGSGPAISINIRYKSTSAQNINAVYTYRLWDATTNTVITKQEGNNLNDQDDSYWLPTPSSVNDGRIIEVFSTLKNNSSDKTTVRVEIEVCQGGQIIKTVTDQKEIPAMDIKFNQIFIQLKA